MSWTWAVARFGWTNCRNNMDSRDTSDLNVENAVKQRYSAAARDRDASLCCPITYNPEYLKVIPQEILDRDYGCGDPSRHVRAGDTVLDLGSGSGKMCFIVSQIVGANGRVIGVDMNDDMLALARKHSGAVAKAIGWHNVEFCKGRIQDLALNLEKLDHELRSRPIDSAAAYLEAECRVERLRQTEPIVATDSVDVVISNCVLNLVDPAAKGQLFKEIFRVLRIGGRAVISDIVSNHSIPQKLAQNPELWSGCISGALIESDFIQAFRSAGFERVDLLQRQEEPWRVIDGIEFRSVTIQAVKTHRGSRGPSVFTASPQIVKPLPSISTPSQTGACCGDSKCC
jgi:arsenite methyltransferase